MKVLIVTSGNSGSISSFVQEQADSIKKQGIIVDFYVIRGKGYAGYLSNLVELKKKIKLFEPELLHAHYGLSALLAGIQRKVPVVSTFHGSDIWVYRKNRMLSQLAHIFTNHSIVVNKHMSNYLLFNNKVSIIPCGVDINLFSPVERQIAKGDMSLPGDKINILFSSSFDYYEKNYQLAEKAMGLLGNAYNLIELKGYTRTEVNLLLNGCDIALMTSISEGSPQFIKEAMACNCPIVSTDVGDVKELITGLTGNYISQKDPTDVAEKIKLVISIIGLEGRTNGRKRIMDLGLDLETIAGRITSVYRSVLN